MNGLIGLISLSALLLAVSGQLSNLSPSFSMQAIITSTNTATGLISTGTYSVSVDITRELQLGDVTLTTNTGVTANEIELLSGVDDAAFVSQDGVCTTATINTDLFPLDTSVWDLYEAGTQDPAGIYTFTLSNAVFQLTLLNGIPAVFTYTSGTTTIGLAVTNFDNTPPAFSTFSLPSECSQFTCTACYQTAPLLTLSPSYSLQGTIVVTNGSVTLSTGTYSVSVDINLKLAIQTETVSGETTNMISLISGNDNVVYAIRAGACQSTSINNNTIPVDSNVWDLFAAGIESPPGTWTYTQQGGAILQLTLVNGSPAIVSATIGTVSSVITVTNFENTTPAFSTFSFPSECSEFTCTACYSSAVSASISILLLLTTLLMYLLTTL